MKILTTLSQPWDFGRLLWSMMGSYITIVSLMNGQYIFVLPGMYFVYQAGMNTGCAACIPSPVENIKENKQLKTTEIEYEEI
jgi:hypothetical protein